MTEARRSDRPLVLLTGPPAARGFGINTHIRMLMSTGLADTYSLEHVELGGATWRSSGVARTRRTLLQLVRFREKVIRRRPAIVHINTAPDTKAFLRDAAALWFARGPDVKTVLEFHGGFEQNTILQGPRPVRDLAKRALRRASVIVTLNGYHTDQLSRLCPGLENIRAVPNFLEAGMMSGLTREPIAPPHDPMRLLFLSRVAREKGVLDAIEAARILRDRGVGIHLEIAGTGGDLDDAKALSAEHGLDRIVEFSGFVTGEDKMRVYLSSDVLLFPTYWNEGFPYVLLEAMAAGLPIVSTTHGVIPHLLKDGVNGYLAEPRNPEALAERIERLALNPRLKIEIGRNNREEVQTTYGIDEAGRAYGHLYGELLGIDPGPAGEAVPQTH